MRKGIVLLIMGTLLTTGACETKRADGESTTTEVTEGGVSNEPTATDAAETATTVPDSISIVAPDSTGALK